MSVPKKQDGWRPGTAQDLETMYHFKERFRELKKLLDLVESGKLDMKAFFTDSGNANFRNGLQYSGSPTKPLYMAVWDADDSADGTQPNRRVRSIEAEGARALMGAAPAGYGYGGQAVALKGSSIITSEEELNTELAKVYDSMESGETKMITWIQYPLSSDWRWFGMLSKSSANNGSLTAHSAYGGGSKIIKNKNRGTWLPAEWENPPMLPGTEYRTTERWKGNAVYVKLVDFGALPNNTYKDVSFAPSNGANSELIDVRIRISANKDSNSTSRAEFDAYLGTSETTNPSFMAYTSTWSNSSGTHVARILTKKDMTNYTATILTKYTKG